jgi:diguanylate cyclase (GGDEF)-like protein
LRAAELAGGAGDEEAARVANAQAREHAERALEVVRAAGQPPVANDVLCRLGACLTACGQLDAARAVLGDAHSQAIRHGDALLKLRADAGLAETLWAAQDPAGTLTLIDQVLDNARTLRDDEVRLRAHLLLCKVHKQQGDAATALEHLEQSQVLQSARASALRAIQARLTRQRIGQERQRSASPRRPPARDSWAATSTMAMLDGGRASRELAAIQDPITGLGNRRHVERELPRLLALTERRKSTLSIALVEVDHLRSVNERFGRSVRDAVLKTLAELMQTHTRTADLIGRTEPDEFVLVMCDATRDGAREACERLRSAVQSHPWESLAAGLVITTSIGLCELDGKLNAAQLLARADRALYFARSKGGNRIVLADDTM